MKGITLAERIAVNAARIRKERERPCQRCGATIRAMDHPFNTCRNVAACERRIAKKANAHA